MPEKEVIQTGVDKLVKLVKDKGKVSLKQASRLLGVDEETIEDWSQFLEDGGLISIEYKFTVPYLVGKKLTKEEIDQKAKEIGDEKNIFMRKTQSAMNYLEMLDQEVNKIETVFAHLEKHSDKSLRHVQNDVFELEKAEKDKERIDKEIEESKEGYLQKISAINKKIKAEKDDYEKISSDIRKEVEETANVFEIEKKEAQSIIDSEKYLEQKLEEVKELSEGIQKKMSGESKNISDSEQKLNILMQRYEGIKNKLQKEKQDILGAMNENKLKEIDITKRQEEIIKKMEQKQKEVDTELSELQDLPVKFKQFIDKKSKIKEILVKVESEEKGLKDLLNQLILKGKVLKTTMGKKEFDKEMKELGEDLDKVTYKRSFFEGQLSKLVSLIKT